MTLNACESMPFENLKWRLTKEQSQNKGTFQKFLKVTLETGFRVFSQFSTFTSSVFVHSLSLSFGVWLTFSFDNSGAVSGDSRPAVRLVLIQSLFVLLHGLMYSFDLVLEHSKAAQQSSGNAAVTERSWNLNKPFRNREDSNGGYMLDCCSAKMLH